METTGDAPATPPVEAAEAAAARAMLDEMTPESRSVLMRGMQQALLGGDRREDDDLRQYHDAVSPADLDVPAGGADRGNPGGDLGLATDNLLGDGGSPAGGSTGDEPEGMTAMVETGEAPAPAPTVPPTVGAMGGSVHAADLACKMGRGR